MSKRTFIALVFTISDKLKNDIADIRKDLREMNVKWVEFQNMHLTLSFLGDTSDGQIEEVKHYLDNIMKNYRQFSIRLKKAGAFKSQLNPQVLWIGIEADETLGLLYRDIQNMAIKSGFEPDTRSFKLTIGRVKNFSRDHNLKEVLEKHGAGIDETTAANAVVFFESTLTPAGPVYRPIETYKMI